MTMHPNAALITKFYESFQTRDARGMANCYSDDIVFSDPAFPNLVGYRAGAMWQMLNERAKDFSLTFENVKADETHGSAHWVAKYLFSKTGRKVVNVVDAAFEFRDGKIVRHTDTFDFWRWSRQSLGIPGVVLGWSGFLQKKVQGEAEKGLSDYIREHKLGAAGAVGG